MKEKFLLSNPGVKLAAGALLLALGLFVLWMDLDFPGTMDFACKRQEQLFLLSPGETVLWDDVDARDDQRWVLRRSGRQYRMCWLDRSCGVLWQPAYFGLPNTWQYSGEALTGYFTHSPIWTTAATFSFKPQILAVAADESIVRVEATLWAEPNGDLGAPYHATTPVTAELARTEEDPRVFLGRLPQPNDEIDAQIDRYWRPSDPYPTWDFEVLFTLRGYDAAGNLVATYDLPSRS